MKNKGFEEWLNGMPVGWEKVLPSIGSTSNNVTIKQESIIKNKGLYSAKIESASPISGLEHSLTFLNEQTFAIYSENGKGAIHFAKENGTSANFSNHELVQENFLYKGTMSTAIRNPMALRLDNGDLIELFMVNSSEEGSGEGMVYAKRNGGETYLFRDDEGVGNYTWAKFLDYESKYTWINLREAYGHVSKVYATDIDRVFENQSNDRVLIEIDNSAVQVYNALIHSSGKTIIPFVYAHETQIYSGPWYLDILVSNDNLQTCYRLNTPVTISGRGIMEPHLVELSDGTVAILFRTSVSYLGRVDFNVATEVLGTPYLTDIIQPSSGSYATNLLDGSIALCWMTASTNYRKVMAFAVSDDDMQTWQSYHVVATSKAINGDMANTLPYIHQPYIFEDIDGRITIYFEEAISGSVINSYKVKSDMNYRKNNVTTKNDEWELFTLIPPSETTEIQLLNVIHGHSVCYFDGDTISNGLNPIGFISLFINGTTIKLAVYDEIESRYFVNICLNGEVCKLNLVDINDSQASCVRCFVGGKLKALEEFNL